MKPGILIIGKDYAAAGVTDDDIDTALDERLALIERHGLSGGGGLLNRDLEVDFTCTPDEPGTTLTLGQWKRFARDYRNAFPTFDGHILITDANHVTRDDSRLLDRFFNL